MGPIDWSYDFWYHFGNYCCNDDRKRNMMEVQIENLFRTVTRFNRGERLRIRNGDFWHDLIDIGMYDGWPYWRPVPAVFIMGPLGHGYWDQFPCVDELAKIPEKKTMYP